MGKIYELSKLRNMNIERYEDGGIIVRIQTIEGKKVRLRLTGAAGAAWAAKLINIRGDLVGHTTHPNVDYTEGHHTGCGNCALPSDSDGSFVARKASQSGSNHSKFSYSVTLHDGTRSTNDTTDPSEYGEKDTVLNGDVPSILDSAEFKNPERARGGKVQGDVSEMIHSIMTTSSSNNSSRRRIIRKQVDELIKKHMREEQQRKETSLSPSAKVDAAFARLANVNTASHSGMHI
ncbi:hypothetical protein Y032_0218g2439 [Ancylostoma ceylanicum]|nr:hypothetical protein Y032_0218g2439 [Ancylostoma ceylanicum]